MSSIQWAHTFMWIKQVPFRDLIGGGEEALNWPLGYGHVRCNFHDSSLLAWCFSPLQVLIASEVKLPAGSLLVFNSLCLFITEKVMAPHSCLEKPMDGGAWWAAIHEVAKSRTRLSDFTFTFHFHALEEEMATQSSVLAWRIPGTGEPGGLPSMGLNRVGHDWSDLAAAACL